MNNTETFPSADEQRDLFTEDEFIEYDEATAGQRFLNYLVDVLLMRFAISYATSYLLATFLLAVSPNTAYTLFSQEYLLLTTYLVALINHLVYYTICEKAFRGYTLGKFITGTRVIREDGEELTFKDALMRSLCRLVPFEAFSAWSEKGLWHDAWTKTKVIKTR